MDNGATSDSLFENSKPENLNGGPPLTHCATLAINVDENLLHVISSRPHPRRTIFLYDHVTLSDEILRPVAVHACHLPSDFGENAKTDIFELKLCNYGKSMVIAEQAVLQLS